MEGRENLNLEQLRVNIADRSGFLVDFDEIKDIIEHIEHYDDNADVLDIVDDYINTKFTYYEDYAEFVYQHPNLVAEPIYVTECKKEIQLIDAIQQVIDDYYGTIIPMIYGYLKEQKEGEENEE